MAELNTFIKIILHVAEHPLHSLDLLPEVATLSENLVDG